jgi:hypothetical protein
MWKPLWQLLLPHLQFFRRRPLQGALPLSWLWHLPVNTRHRACVYAIVTLSPPAMRPLLLCPGLGPLASICVRRWRQKAGAVVERGRRREGGGSGGGHCLGPDASDNRTDFLCVLISQSGRTRQVFPLRHVRLLLRRGAAQQSSLYPRQHAPKLPSVPGEPLQFNLRVPRAPLRTHYAPPLSPRAGS